MFMQLDVHATIGYYIHDSNIDTYQYGILYFTYQYNISDRDISEKLKVLFPRKKITQEIVGEDRKRIESKLSKILKKKGVIYGKQCI
jgi:hypothetical protein